MPSFKKSSLVQKATVADEAGEDVKGSQNSFAWAALGSPGLRGEAAVGRPERAGHCPRRSRPGSGCADEQVTEEDPSRYNEEG